MNIEHIRGVLAVVTKTRERKRKLYLGLLLASVFFYMMGKGKTIASTISINTNMQLRSEYLVVNIRVWNFSLRVLTTVWISSSQRCRDDIRLHNEVQTALYCSVFISIYLYFTNANIQ